MLRNVEIFSSRNKSSFIKKFLLEANLVNIEKLPSRGHPPAAENLWEGNSFPCKVCGKLFSHKSNLMQHEHFPNRETFQCNECGKAVIPKQHVIKHQNTHTREKSFWMQ
jgi:hypothetical protein